jgi:hypothetical protein
MKLVLYCYINLVTALPNPTRFYLGLESSASTALLSILRRGEIK